MTDFEGLMVLAKLYAGNRNVLQIRAISCRFRISKTSDAVAYDLTSGLACAIRKLTGVRWHSALKWRLNWLGVYPTIVAISFALSRGMSQ